MGMVVNGERWCRPVWVVERIRPRRGGVLVLMRKAPDEFCIRNYPFECGSKGGKSKTGLNPPALSSKDSVHCSPVDSNSSKEPKINE